MRLSFTGQRNSQILSLERIASKEVELGSIKLARRYFAPAIDKTVMAKQWPLLTMSLAAATVIEPDIISR
jgi:hypothetical protein